MLCTLWWFKPDKAPTQWSETFSIYYELVANPCFARNDCWPSHCWLLILSPPGSTVKCWSSIASLLTIDPLTVDCWSTPPRINSQQCWSSIASLLTVDCWPSHCWLLIHPPRINSQQCWLLIASLLTVDPLTVDCWSSPPTTDSNFVIFNILILAKPPDVYKMITKPSAWSQSVNMKLCLLEGFFCWHKGSVQNQ